MPFCISYIDISFYIVTVLQSPYLIIVKILQSPYLIIVTILQSPYFASMFGGSWREAEMSTVDIDIVDDNITQECK